MKLSLRKVLTELTARQGPRTGAFEFDEDAVWELADDIAQHLKEGGLKERKFEVHLDDPIYGMPSTVDVVLKKPTKDNITGGWDLNSNTIFLYILDPEWIEADLYYLQKGIFSVLVHELAHKFDPEEKNLKDYKVEEEHGKEEYMNQPIEVRAFLQSAVGEIQEDFPWHNPEMVKKARQDPTIVLNYSHTWKMIENHLYDPNIKRFYKMAFDLTQAMSQRRV